MAVAGLVASAVALLVPGSAHAQSRSLTDPSCIGHTLSADPTDRLEITTHLDNQCGRRVALQVTYRAFGPCSPSASVPVQDPMVPIDVVINFRLPCQGHYTLQQQITVGGTRVGQDLVEFDIVG